MNDCRTGMVSKLVFARGFGFLKPDDGGEDLFWHKQDLTGWAYFEDIREGMKVRYRIKTDYTGQDLVSEVEALLDEMPVSTQTGTINRIIPKGFYGFIQPDGGGKVVFFHRTGVVEPIDFMDLKPGDKVAYLEDTDKRGRFRAIGIVRE